MSHNQLFFEFFSDLRIVLSLLNIISQGRIALLLETKHQTEKQA